MFLHVLVPEANVIHILLYILNVLLTESSLASDFYYSVFK
jgi:hypothetical protein